MSKNNKKWFVIILFVVFAYLFFGGLILLAFLAHKIIPTENNMLFVATVGPFIGAIAALAVPFISDWINSLEGKYQIDIQVKDLGNNMVSFSATIENVGHKDVIVNVANIYVDEGTETPKGNKFISGKAVEEGAVFYDFPFLLQHIFDGKNPKKSKCVLCRRCRNGELVYPIGHVEERFQNGDFYYTNIAMRHLTKESITYIESNQKYSEDVILQFKRKGVYRVTFVVISNNNKDCQCATKQFYINDDENIGKIAPDEKSVTDHDNNTSQQKSAV